MNSRTGREYRMPDLVRKSECGKRVLVVGGGPAGMAAALTSAMRGNVVTLCESSEALGGAMRSGSVPPDKSRMSDLVSWYVHKLENADVKVKLKTPCTTALIEKERPDVLIVATGAEYMRFIDGSNQASVMTASEALLHPEKIGQKVVIVGGGVSGSETAEYFSGQPVKLNFTGVTDLGGETLVYSVEKREGVRPRDISIVEMRDDLCADMFEDNARIMRIKLKEYGVKSYLGTLVEKIEDGRIHLKMKNGKRFSLETDTVILAAGLSPKPLDIDLPANIMVYTVGDAGSPGKIKDAIYAGDTIGRVI